MKGKKKVPDFWWDFRGESIIIESDDDRYPIVWSHPTGAGDAMKEIEMANQIILDLKSGRTTIKKVMKGQTL